MKGAAAVTLLALCLAAAAGRAADPAHHDHGDSPQVLAPGYSALQFDAPTPGSYELPALGRAADGVLLDSEGRKARLHAMYGDKTVVLSFIYTSCNDVNGCPLASFVLRQVQKRIGEDPALRDEVRLLSVSFDPRNDTPARMREYAERFRLPLCEWRFLTSESEEALQPVLDSYDQFVKKDYDASGRPLGTLSHVLRVFLIDRDMQIRNIYSPSFLHADVLAADIRTVLSDTRGGGG